MTTPLALRRADKWRQALNPLRNLTVQRAVSLLEEGERGQYAALQWTYRFAEKRDAVLRGLKRLRLASISKLPWQIRKVDDSRAAEQQAAYLRFVYNTIDNMREALRFLALAEFRGFSHLEKRYHRDDPRRPIVRLEPVEQWFWCRDTALEPWHYNARADATTRGMPIDLDHFVIREVEDPIDEIGLLCLVMKALAKKDWAGYVEVYGIPPLFGELPADGGDEVKAAEFQAMMEAVVGDMRGTIPAGAKIHTVGDSVRGVNPFREFLDFVDAELVRAGTGGKLAMLNDATGIGSGQSALHGRIFDTLAAAEAGEISELLQRSIDAPALEAMFPGEPVLAYFKLAAESREDAGLVLDHAVKARQAGLDISLDQLSEKTGYPLERIPPPIAARPAFPTVASREPARMAPQDDMTPMPIVRGAPMMLPLRPSKTRP